MRAKNDNGDFRFPEFKTDKNATTVKTVLYQQQNRQRPMNHKEEILNKLTHVWPKYLCQVPKITK